MDRLDARKAVIEDINEADLAVTMRDEEGQEAPFVESKLIMQPFGDRSKVVIEPMLTDQWFVDTARIVGPALEAVREGRTKIMPESGEPVYFHWLENIQPSCLARLLRWGHQNPVCDALDPARTRLPAAAGDRRRAAFFQRACRVAQGSGGIHHVIDHYAILTLDFANDVHDFRLVRFGATFVDNNQVSIF